MPFPSLIRDWQDAHKSRPRWLYTAGKPEAARRTLAKLHSSNNDINSPLVDVEMDEIEETIKLSGSDSASIIFPACFPL